MNKKNTILVPVDFKVFSLKSVDYAKNLQAVFQDKIHLVHVIESQSWWTSQFNSGEIKRTAAEKLEQFIIDHSLPQNTEYTVLQGKPHVEIAKYAKEINSRYIVMADNYPLTTSVKRLGSTLSQVITKAEQPVVSITNTEDNLFKNMVVPLDLTESSRMQLYNSIAIALNYGTKIHLVSVLFEEQDLKSSRIIQKIEKYKKAYEENDIDYSVKLLVKEKRFAYREIIKYSEQQKADSILIMTHNESASFDNYLGTFAQHIINEATMPVISINNTSAKYWESKLGAISIDPLGVFSSKQKGTIITD